MSIMYDFRAQNLDNIVYLPPYCCKTNPDDRVYFLHNQHRNHYIRPLNRHDMECCGMEGIFIGPELKGMRWVVLVRQIKSGITLPVFCQMFPQVGIDAPEEMCAFLYAKLVTPERLALGNAIAADAEARTPKFAFKWGADDV